MALRIPIVDIAMPLFLFIVPHISPRPPRRRRGRFIVPVPPNTPQNGVAYSHCWRCNSYHFDISKPFDSDCKTGAMNRPLRLTECSLPYICAINGYYGMFVAIHLRYPFRYFYLLYPTFRHVHPVGVGADLSCPCPRNTHKTALRWCYLAI